LQIIKHTDPQSPIVVARANEINCKETANKCTHCWARIEVRATCDWITEP